jgi:hypothetical protein
MGPNRRAQGRERAAAEAAAKAKRAEAERKAIAEALKIVAIWNARQASGRAWRMWTKGRERRNASGVRLSSYSAMRDERWRNALETTSVPRFRTN